MCAHLVHWIHAFRQSQYDRSGWMLIDQGTSMWPYECRDAETWCYPLHVTRRGEIDQPHTIGGSVRVEAELSDSGAKDTFPPDLGIKISEDDFCVMGRALSSTSSSSA